MSESAAAAPPPKYMTLQYTLHPPQEVDQEGIGAPTKASQSFLIPSHLQQQSSSTDSLPSPSRPEIKPGQSPTSQYYTSAASTLRQVQASLNSSLTIWKDAIGDREKHKEDLGKVGYGQGRAARMAAGDKEVATPDEEDSDEDGVNGEEV